jgi:Terminase large subunit, T4likevirus-type, N-terminal
LNTNRHKLTLYGAQREVWAAMMSDQNACLVLPIGSGKSYLASWLLCVAATTPAMNKGRDILYVAPTAPMVSRIIWKELKERCQAMWNLEDEKHINNSSKTITFPNGIRIFCLSAETGLKGINASVIVADEAAEFSEEALQELSNRTRPNPGQVDSSGRMILISTPEGKNAFHDIYQFALAHPESWVTIHRTWEQMRVQPRSWIESQRELLSPLKFAKDLECSWGSVEDQFFYSWRREFVQPTRDRGRELYYFGDFNKKRMCGIIAQVVGDIRSSTGRIEVLKSYAIPNCGTDGIADAVRADFPQRTIQAIVDRSGSHVNRDTTSEFGITDQTILESRGFRMMNTARGNPLITDTDNSSNAFINRGGLIIPDTETLLLDAIETFHFEDANRKNLVKYRDAKYMHIDGLGDALRYGINYLFPMRHESHGMPEYVDSVDDFYHEPGHEYLTENTRQRTHDGVPTIDYLIRKTFEDQDESWN